MTIQDEIKALRADVDKKITALEKKIKPENIMEAVQSFDDALAIYKEKHHISKEIQMLLDYKGSDADVIAQQGFAQINIIRTVLNEGWVPDWKNSGEYKNYPWFDMTSGVGLSCNDYVITYTFTDVGSRLCYKTRDLAIYAGKQFTEIYQKFFII